MKPTTDSADIPHADYRSSHLEEGEAYHAKFQNQIYRALMWEIERDILLGIVERLPDPRHATLMDFACGTGRVLEALAPVVGRAVGVDISASMLEVARRLVPAAEIHCCDLTRSAELDGRRFDVITAFRFFPNAEPALRDEAMAKLATLLADDGLLVINNHRRRGSLKHRARKLRSLFGLAKRKDMHTMADVEVYELAARHGLEVASEHTAGLLPVLKERRPLLPASLIRPVERWAAGVAALAPLGSHRVYVLRRRRPGN
jgi:predicted TPR repeat methyltransferase